MWLVPQTQKTMKCPDPKSFWSEIPSAQQFILHWKAKYHCSDFTHVLNFPLFPCFTWSRTRLLISDSPLSGGLAVFAWCHTSVGQVRCCSWSCGSAHVIMYQKHCTSWTEAFQDSFLRSSCSMSEETPAAANPKGPFLAYNDLCRCEINVLSALASSLSE